MTYYILLNAGAWGRWISISKDRSKDRAEKKLRSHRYYAKRYAPVLVFKCVKVSAKALRTWIKHCHKCQVYDTPDTDCGDCRYATIVEQIPREICAAFERRD